MDESEAVTFGVVDGDVKREFNESEELDEGSGQKYNEKKMDKKKDKKKKKNKKKKQNRGIDVGDGEESVANSSVMSPKSVTTSKKSKKSKKSKIRGESNLEKRNDRHLWVRLANEKDEIYYYNIMTEEYAWLAPCVICGGPSQQWCIECMKPFCASDFPSPANHVSQIDNQTDGSSSIPSSLLTKPGSAPRMFSGSLFMGNSKPSGHSHTWQSCEPFHREELPVVDSTVVTSSSTSMKAGSRSGRQMVAPLGPTYCVECRLRVASKLCTECWDAYCLPCCELRLSYYVIQGAHPYSSS